MVDNMTQTNSFLGDMETVISGTVLSLTKYEIDSNSKGGSIWVSKPNTGQNPNNLGLELIKIKMDYAMFDQQKAKVDEGAFNFPCQMEIHCRIDMGGQNRAVLQALSMRLSIPEPQPLIPEPQPLIPEPQPLIPEPQPQVQNKPSDNSQVDKTTAEILNKK